MSSALVIDIETVGLPWDGLASDVQAYLLQRARTDEEREEVPKRLALHPGTGRIVAIGLWRPEEDRGGVLLADDALEGGAPASWEPFEEGAMVFRASERGILQEFWRYVKQGAGTIVTFNGRGFDGPFLMLRSAILGVPPARNLMPYRYRFDQHCDLLEVLTFFRSRPADSLHFWCRQFGIETPKGEMSGSDVAAAYEAGALDAIARYALADVRATAELYRRLKPVIDVLDG